MRDNIIWGDKNIERKRNGVVKNNILVEDIKVNSPSSAGNFVTGKSTNGCVACVIETGEKLKTIRKSKKKM